MVGAALVMIKKSNRTLMLATIAFADSAIMSKYDNGLTKRCYRCKQILAANCFSANSSRPLGLASACKECSKKSRREAYARDKQKVKNKVEINRRIRKYGLTPEVYQELLDYQNYKCGICLKPFIEIEKRKVSIDHNHKTGAVRGLLCILCNMGIGSLKDDVGSFQRAIEYINSDGVNYTRETQNG